MGENAMLKISVLLKEWKNKNLLWNLSSAMDFKDLLYTHPAYLEKININELPEVYIHTDFCREILTQLKLSNHYYHNFSYSKNEEELLRQDIDPRKKSYRNRPNLEFPLFYNHERDYCVKEINEIIFEDKSLNGFRTRITLITSERILNDLDIYQYNSIKYVHFPEIGFPEFFALKLRLKVESDTFSTRELDVYYFFMENVNFLRDIVFHYNLKLSTIHYMHDGRGFGYNNHSNLWILKYLTYLRTKYLILNTGYFNREELIEEDYLSSDNVNQLHRSILEQEEFLRKIPDHYLRSFQVKAFYRNTKREIVWARPISVKTKA